MASPFALPFLPGLLDPYRAGRTPTAVRLAQAWGTVLCVAGGLVLPAQSFPLIEARGKRRVSTLARSASTRAPTTASALL